MRSSTCARIALVQLNPWCCRGTSSMSRFVVGVVNFPISARQVRRRLFARHSSSGSRVGSGWTSRMGRSISARQSPGRMISEGWSSPSSPVDRWSGPDRRTSGNGRRAAPRQTNPGRKEPKLRGCEHRVHRVGDEIGDVEVQHHGTSCPSARLGRAPDQSTTIADTDGHPGADATQRLW